MGHQGRDWIARAKDVSEKRAVMCDRDRSWDYRIACRLTSHTKDSLVDRDGSTAGSLLILRRL